MRCSFLLVEAHVLLTHPGVFEDHLGIRDTSDYSFVLTETPDMTVRLIEVASTVACLDTSTAKNQA